MDPVTASTPTLMGTPSSAAPKYLKARIGGNRHGIELETELPKAIWGWELVQFTTVDGRQAVACVACSPNDVPADILQAATMNSFATLFPLPPPPSGGQHPPTSPAAAPAGS
jgi:hypothetical protein